MRIRIKFRKYGVMRFIGHLDIMRYFQKAMRRANIDIAYSEGFSPHQIMSFAAPLGVGITSDGEYLDIEAKSTKSTQESIAALNAVMVDGIEITQYVALRQDEKKLQNLANTIQLSLKNGIMKREEHLQLQTARLRALDPLAKLSGGYGYITKQGRTVSSVREVSMGDVLTIRVCDGTVQAVVEQVSENEESR